MENIDYQTGIFSRGFILTFIYTRTTSSKALDDKHRKHRTHQRDKNIDIYSVDSKFDI